MFHYVLQHLVEGFDTYKLPINISIYGCNSLPYIINKILLDKSASGKVLVVGYDNVPSQFAMQGITYPQDFLRNIVRFGPAHSTPIQLFSSGSSIMVLDLSKINFLGGISRIFFEHGSPKSAPVTTVIPWLNWDRLSLPVAPEEQLLTHKDFPNTYFHINSATVCAPIHPKGGSYINTGELHPINTVHMALKAVSEVLIPLVKRLGEEGYSKPLLIMHHPSLQVYNLIRRKVSQYCDVPDFFDLPGNTSAPMPLTVLLEALNSGLIRSGQPVVWFGFGLGASCTAVAFIF